MTDEDVIVDTYGEWLNDVLFGMKWSDGESVHWLGGHRWALHCPADQVTILIELKKARVVPVEEMS